ncbi:MAG: AmmeMemoRadiSam system protein A [Syntrophobacterales bacterium]|jgi:AmmeMemoRadiSam system protein A|nr:AmmeMemoRadiSam system protein A [Syntrophobacterales bacterium]
MNSLLDTDKVFLKKITKEAIEAVLFHRGKVFSEVPETLQEKMGAFVTLRTNKEELRGCIGYTKGVLPLHQTVREMAVQAAFHDQRFKPACKDEWDDIDVEISVLSSLRKIKSLENIKVGVHGILIEKGFNSGLLLPQVAVENGWDRAAFVEYACRKAGLPKDAWKSKEISIYIFSAEVF